MRITILGSGTSTGVPMIGCVKAQHQDPKNQRLRVSCLLEPFGAGGPSLLIDTSPDLRQQVLRYFPKKNPRLDAVLITHDHADHIHGIDDVRPFNFLQRASIPFYGEKKVLQSIKARFPYIFPPKTAASKKAAIPQIDLYPIGDKSFFLKAVKDKRLQKIKVTPLPVLHGKQSCFGYRVQNFAYITDCKKIPEKTLSRLKKLDLLVLDCLRHEEHFTHLTVKEAFHYAKKINAKRTIFTHMASSLEYYSFTKELPPRCQAAYDGLRVKLSS